MKKKFSLKKTVAGITSMLMMLSLITIYPVYAEDSQAYVEKSEYEEGEDISVEESIPDETIYETETGEVDAIPRWDKQAHPCKIYSVKATKISADEVMITWSSEPEPCFDGYARGYWIQVSCDGKLLVDTIVSEDTTSYLVSNINNEKDTRVSVFAFVVHETSGVKTFSEDTGYVYVRGGCLPAKNVVASSRSGAVNLTWDKDPYADGYLIYGYHGSSKNGATYGYIGMTTSGTSFVDRRARKDDWNFYWVYPYYLDENGKMIPNTKTTYVYGKAR